MVTLAPREFQQRLDEYIKRIYGTLANVTYRQVEVEFYYILFHLQWQFDSIPRRGHAAHVQRQHVHKYLKKADQFFIRVRKLDIVYLERKVTKVTQ